MKKRRLFAAAISAVLLFQTVNVAAVDTMPQETEAISSDKQVIAIKEPAAGMVINETSGTDDVISEFSDTNDETDNVNPGLTGNALPLEEGAVQYNSISTKCEQIPCESLGGIYFLNGTVLSFYSVETNEISQVYSLGSYSDCYVANNKLYILMYNSDITVYDLMTQTVDTTFHFENPASAIGADSLGRIYLAGSSDENHMIYLLSASGEILSQAVSEESIYSFCGFDSSNGNFYVESYDNWIYWGYDHDMHALKAGNVTGDTISFNETILMYVCQSYWYERQGQVSMLGDRYFCIDSTFSSGLSIWDSDQYDPSDPSDTEVVFLSRDNEESGTFDSKACVGTRAVYCEGTNSVIVYKDESSIAEYDISAGTEIVSARTDYPVFSLMKYGDGIAAIEKSGNNYYFEYFSWIRATEVQIYGEKSELTVGKTLQLSAETNGTLTEVFSWSSSNPEIASINQQGEVFGWSEGDATITVRTKGGLSAQYVIRVTKDSASDPAQGGSSVTTGEESDNQSDNNYSVWSQTLSLIHI